MDNILYDLRQTLRESSREECYFLAGRISKAMEKNRFGLFWDRDGEMTKLGEIMGGIFELILVHGVMKWQPGGEDGNNEN